MSLPILPILDLKQNTPEWHQWRAQGLGASEIAALYGKHPYLTEYQLWLQKTGQAEGFKGNVATEHGQREEPKVLQFLKDSFEEQLLTGICIQHKKYPHLRASLDSYYKKEKTIFEIKCPYGKKNRSIAKIEDVPEYWIYQLEYQIAIVKSCIQETYGAFYIWDDQMDFPEPIFLKQDIALQADMIQKAHEWWQHHVVMGNPVPPDTIYLSQEEVKNKLSLYEEYQHTAKQIDAQKRALKCEIEAFLDGQSNYHTETHQIIRTSPRTSYDFNAMKMDGIDFSKYRIQNGSEGSYTIKAIKKKENK